MKVTELAQLGDDALQCVFLALDNVAQDVLFVALTCRGFLRALRPALLRRDKERRQCRFLVPDPDADGKLRTSVAGLFLSASRIEFAKRQLNAECLPAEHAFGTGVAHSMPIETFWHIAKVAPCSVVLDTFRAEVSGSVTWPALMQFSARHGRVDVLSELGHSGQEHPHFKEFDVLKSQIFTSEARHALFARPTPPSGVYTQRNRAFVEMVHVLVRPAILGRQTKVIEWFREAALFYSAGDWYHEFIGMHSVEFAGICLRRETVMHDFAYSQESVVQLRLAVGDAASVDFAEPVVAFLEQIIEKYVCITNCNMVHFHAAIQIDTVDWLVKIFYVTVVTVFNSRFGRGRIAEAVADVCTTNRATLRDMFGEYREGDQPFGLVALDAMWEDFLGVGSLTNRLFSTVYHGGDPHYVCWLLFQFFGESRGANCFLEGVLERFSATLLANDLPGVCRVLMTVYAMDFDNRRGELCVPRLCNASKYHRIRAEDLLYAYALKDREGLDDLDPTELERGVALTMRRWIAHVLVTPDAPTGIPIEWFNAMKFAPVAMLPHMNRLYLEHAQTPRQRKALRDLVVGAAVVCFESGPHGQESNASMISHLALAYRHGIVARKCVDAAVRDAQPIDARFDDVDAGLLFADVGC
jgi:hypothetical protein